MVEETCKRFDLQANIHVYTCLLQACIQKATKLTTKY